MGGAFQTVIGVTPRALQFDDGATMDANVVAGSVVELIGTTTRARIALLECATVAPVTYRLLGKAHWWQADGDEFTGVFKWVDQALATHSWGVAGSRATGGLISGGDGAQFLEGLVLLRGVQRTVAGEIRLDTLDLTAGNGCWLGTTRTAALTLFSGGGLGVNATPAYACVAFIAQDLETPTLTANAAFVGAPSTAAEQVIWAEFDASVAGSATEIARCGILESGGQQQIGSQASAANAASTNDRRVVFSGRTIIGRLLTLELVGQT